MRIVSFPEHSILARIHEQVLSYYPVNPKGQRVLFSVELDDAEWEELQENLRDFVTQTGLLPAWAQAIRVNGRSPYLDQPIQVVQNSPIAMK